MDLGLQGKVAVVTGAGSGIGRASAKAFAGALKKKNCFPQKIGGQWHWVNIGLDRGSLGHNEQNGHEAPID